MTSVQQKYIVNLSQKIKNLLRILVKYNISIMADTLLEVSQLPQLATAENRVIVKKMQKSTNLLRNKILRISKHSLLTPMGRKQTLLLVGLIIIIILMRKVILNILTRFKRYILLKGQLKIREALQNNNYQTPKDQLLLIVEIKKMVKC